MWEIRNHSSSDPNWNPILCPDLPRGVNQILTPGIELHSIYISIDSSGFSLLEALEWIQIHRPVTPVFLIGQEEDPILSVLGISGTLPSSSTPLDVIQHHQERCPGPSPLPAGKRVQTLPGKQGVIAVSIRDFAGLGHYPADVFLMDTPSLKLFASKGARVDPDYLKQAFEKGDRLLIRAEGVQAIRASIAKARREIFHHPKISNQWKVAEVLMQAKSILHELGRELPNPQILDRALIFLESLRSTLESIRIPEENLLVQDSFRKLITHERALAGLTLSMLVCSWFRFDSAGIIEILGLASLLQDVSLMHSPYGDLSEINPEELSFETRAYFEKHPTLSADLLSAIPDLPEVVLQVIRQQHEAKDRSGFPNRIGGTQLHPMAEVISMINRVLDLREVTKDSNQLRNRLENEVFPHYSQEMVNAMKGVMGFPGI